MSQDQSSTITTSFGSGNPGYVDASSGPSKPIPNAKPHGMPKKKKPFQEGKTFSPTEAGYVDNPIPKQCGTCEYFQSPDICLLPLSIHVDPKDGCCNFWSPEKDIKPSSEISTVGRRFCRSCSKSADEKTVTCPQCGSMEWTDKPMSKYTYSGT